MNTRLDFISAKVTRAEQHIQDFQRAVASFCASRPYETGVKIDADAGNRVYYLVSVRDVPLGVATIAADVLQNLRSALDHIVYQLVLDANPHASAKELKRCHFPITSTASEYPALRARNVKGVRQDAIDAIDATEPYKGGRGHALWQLSELNNIDKHHLLIAVGFYFGGIYASSFVDKEAPEALKRAMADSGVCFSISELLPLKSGDQLLAEPLDFEVKDDLRLRFDVSLNHPWIIGCESALKTLQDLAHLVSGMVNAFAPFFP